MPSWRHAALGTALAMMCIARTGSAQPGRHPSLHIDCPALNEEARASLEARAEAELASEPLPEGELTVKCATSATLQWTLKGEAPRERQVAPTGDGAEDAILAALHALLFETASAPAPPPAAPPAEPPAPPPSAPGVTPPSHETSTPYHVRVSGVVGGDVELWQGAVSVALGAYAGIAVSPWKRWTMSLAIAPQWGLESAQQISAFGLRGVARVDYEIQSQLELGIGVSARNLWANTPAATTSQLEGMTGGAILSARYVLRLGPVALSMGPRVEVLVSPIVVDFAGHEVFRIPSVVSGVMVEGAAP